MSESSVAEPKVSKRSAAEVNGWERVKEVSGWSWHCARYVSVFRRRRNSRCDMLEDGLLSCV